MRKSRILALTTMGAMLALAGPADASLLAYYSFDSDGTATVGTDATLGANATVSTTTSAVGAGSLHLGVPVTDAPVGSSDGAVSGNTFSWATDTRAVNFWMLADASQDTNPTMLSLGASATNGYRFDLRLSGTALRLEIQGGGATTSTTVADGNWYNITVSLGDPATVQTPEFWVYDSSANLVGSGTFGSFTAQTTAIATADGPLRMGDSYQDTSRDFYGYLDEVRLYDNTLNQSDALALAQMWNPVAVPEPSSAMLAGLGIATVLICRRRL